MSNNQKNSSPLLEDERIRKELSKRFGLPPYWTFQEGINFFLPVEYQNSFPLSVIINDYLFEMLRREVETQRLETFNKIEEVEKILDYDPVAAYEKRKATWTKERATKIQLRNLKSYGSKERKFSFDEIQEEKRKYFCSNIRIKPEILICYIIDHIDLFSNEVEIPSWLARLIDDVQGAIKNRDNQNSRYTFPGKQIDSWDKLEIILVSHEMVTIKTPHDSKNLTFQQIGMANKQNPEKPQKVWEALKVFALLNGKFPNRDFPDAEIKNEKDRTKELNERLKQFFNLPNKSIYKNHYRKNHCWETNFKISSKLDLPSDETLPPSISESEIESATRSVNLPERNLYDE